MTSPMLSPGSSSLGVILPCSQEDFGSFISSLLGRPQTIRRIKLCAFDLTRADIENTYHLVDQRVQQNQGTLIEFTARITYNDYSSIELKSLEEFTLYREVRPLVSRSLSMEWTYLIHFPKAKAPEKQTIELNFATRGVETPGIAKTAIGTRPFYDGSAIYYEIAHTSRTWGADIESLLNGHIESLVKDESPIAKFIYKYSGWIGLFSSMIFMLLVVFGALVAANAISHALAERYHNLPPADTIPELSAQVRNVVEVTANGTWHRFNFLQGVYFILSLILSVILGIWVAIKADNRPPSFLLLTEKSVTERNKRLNDRSKGWIQFGISLIVTVVGGASSRVVFYYISKWWLT